LQRANAGATDCLKVSSEMTYCCRVTNRNNYHWTTYPSSLRRLIKPKQFDTCIFRIVRPLRMHWVYNRLIDFTSHSTHYRSFRRRSCQPSSLLGTEPLSALDVARCYRRCSVVCVSVGHVRKHQAVWPFDRCKVCTSGIRLSTPISASVDEAIHRRVREPCTKRLSRSRCRLKHRLG